jgi:hypothetical protein
MNASLNRIRNEQGFSMAEVVVAVVLFVASILGVSVMLVSGGQNVTRGAKESAAANLAAKKVEEVKSIRWYVPWAGTPADVDDYYFNTSYANSAQLDHPYVTEDYGTIPGYTNYRRTTAIQYQYVPTGVSASMVPAVMNQSWVPRAPTSGQFDRPKGGTIATDANTIHAMIVEVKVNYVDGNGTTQTVTQRGLLGDQMVTGGTNRPPLVVTSISPDNGFYGNTDLVMTIYVDADGMNASSQVTATLWRDGYNDIPCTSASSNSPGTQITAHFNLVDQPGATPPIVCAQGVWNLAVTWRDRGFDDKSMRNCFTVNVPPPSISGIATYNWGYRTQVSRRITMTGTNMANPTMVQLRGRGSFSSLVCPGSVASSNVTQALVDFNLTSIPATYGGNSTNQSRWDIEYTTAGGSTVTTSWADANRFWVDPAPKVTGITAWPNNYTSGGSYPNGSYFGTGPYGYNASKQNTGIAISGEYLQPGVVVYIFNDPSGTGDVHQSVVYQPLAGGTTNADGTSITGCSANLDLSMPSTAFYRLAGGMAQTITELAPYGASPTNYGRYYAAAYCPADGQVSWDNWPDCAAYRDVTARRYTMSLGSWQNTVGNTRFGWPSSGSGTYWQDESSSCGATASNGTYAGFREWIYNSATYSTSNPVSVSMNKDMTMYCRFYQYLYYNGTQVVPWIQWAKTDNPYSANINNGGWIDLYGKYSFLNHGEVSTSTNAIDLTGCTALGVYWKNTRSDIAQISTYTSSGGAWDENGNIVVRRDGGFGATWAGYSIPGGDRTSNRYIRIHAANDNPGSTDESETWVQYLYVE